MAKDNKKYYWIKLKTDFFNQPTIDFLLSQKNGCEYIVLYQMLCLNTANQNGAMCSQIGEMLIPYDVDKIVRDTKYFDFDTVTIAMGLFKKLGLIYEESNEILQISNFDEMVGSETQWAKKKRLYRENKKMLPEGQSRGQNEGQNEDIVRQEKEIEIRDKSKEIDKDNNIVPKAPYKTEINDLFEYLWSLYPAKKGKGQISYSKKKELYAIGKDEMERAINRYLADLKKDADWRKPQNGSTFFNSGYVDYLDANYTEDIEIDTGKGLDAMKEKSKNDMQRFMDELAEAYQEGE